MALDPQSSAAHYNFGVALWYGGQRTEAVTQLKEAVKLDPASGAAYAFLGMSLKDLGDDEPALDSLACALALNANDFSAYMDQAVILLKMHKLGPALHQFEAALRLDTHAAEGQPDLAEAISQLKQVAQGKDDLPEVHLRAWPPAWLGGCQQRDGHAESSGPRFEKHPISTKPITPWD